MKIYAIDCGYQGGIVVVATSIEKAVEIIKKNKPLGGYLQIYSDKDLLSMLDEVDTFYEFVGDN